jgi:hypothetical protein
MRSLLLFFASLVLAVVAVTEPVPAAQSLCKATSIQSLATDTPGVGTFKDIPPAWENKQDWDFCYELSSPCPREDCLCIFRCTAWEMTVYEFPCSGSTLVGSCSCGF